MLSWRPVHVRPSAQHRPLWPAAVLHTVRFPNRVDILCRARMRVALSLSGRQQVQAPPVNDSVNVARRSARELKGTLAAAGALGAGYELELQPGVLRLAEGADGGCSKAFGG